MIIDAHVHITENGKWFETNHDASLNKLLVSLDECKINKAVLLPICPYISNEYIRNVCDEYPDKFFGFCSVNPFKKDAMEDLEHFIVDFGLKGLKLHPKLQGFSVYDESIKNVMNKAVELNIPVLIDAWVRQDEIKSNKIIILIETIAQNHPFCKIVLPHLGGHSYKKMPTLSQNLNNIFFDISYIFSKFDDDILQKEIFPLLQKIDSKRMIYGSDFPEIEINQYFKKSKKAFNDLHYSSRDVNAIFSKNIQKLLS